MPGIILLKYGKNTSGFGKKFIQTSELLPHYTQEYYRINLNEYKPSYCDIALITYSSVDVESNAVFSN
jgi:hypothetical protein